MKNVFRKVREWWLRPVMDKLEKARIAQGRMEARQIMYSGINDIRETEFQVFSQHGEDGIIQYLISKVPLKNKYFVEFGVESYRESNTRFLLMNNNWAGLIMDGNKDHIKYVNKESFLGINHDIKAIQVYLTPENINSFLQDEKVPEEPGILSIDIDFNDYWVLKAIKSFKPAVLITEFNRAFGADKKVSVPMQEGFRVYSSGIYFGASLGAMYSLASEKGYVFAGTESRGVNAFFVRRDLAGGIKEADIKEAHDSIHFDRKQVLEELKEIKHHVLYDFEDNKEKEIKEIFDF